MGLSEAEPQDGGRIRAAQIAAIARLTPFTMLASCLNANLLVLTLWHLGSLTPPLVIWAWLVMAMAAGFLRTWRKGAGRVRRAQASLRAIRSSVVIGLAFGALWGAMPAMLFPGAAPPIQLLVASMAAGMMCAGGFVLSSVPMAGICYVAAVLAGCYVALIRDGLTDVHLIMLVLLTVYAGVVVVNLCWNAQLFVEHFLAEAQLEREVNAREQAQAETALAQRMAALGQMAGGIAHDFNNILQSVAGNANLIACRAEDAAQNRRLSASILMAAERGGAISRRLLAFARQDILHAEPVDVRDLLTEAHELLRHTIDSSVELRVDVPDALPSLSADKSQLESVLVNLATNARDAMRSGGVLTLSAACEAAAGAGAGPALRAGNYIRLTVTDTGIGMTPATLARAIEPFFTTKPQGRGTGLGLSMAKGFAEQSGGAFAIESAPGKGTSVSLWLPQSEHEDASPVRRFPRRKLLGRAGHVMLVDDDREVRESLAFSLRDAGFTVLSARDAAGALAQLDEGQAVDVLLSDLLMPGMDGMELIRSARARRPGLGAILLTGHVGDLSRVTGSDPDCGPVVLLLKPIRLPDLVERLEELCRAKRDSVVGLEHLEGGIGPT